MFSMWAGGGPCGLGVAPTPAKTGSGCAVWGPWLAPGVGAEKPSRPAVGGALGAITAPAQPGPRRTSPELVLHALSWHRHRLGPCHHAPRSGKGVPWETVAGQGTPARGCAWPRRSSRGLENTGCSGAGGWGETPAGQWTDSGAQRLPARGPEVPARRSGLLATEPGIPEAGKLGPFSSQGTFRQEKASSRGRGSQSRGPVPFRRHKQT